MHDMSTNAAPESPEVINRGGGPSGNSEPVPVLIIQPALAPYRLVFFNSLAGSLSLRLLFTRGHLLGQQLDSASMREKLICCHRVLNRGITLFSRDIKFGIGKELGRFKPRVVVTQEFSPATIYVALYRLFTMDKYAHVIWTDDNPQSIHNDGTLRKILRKMLLPMTDGLILLSVEAEETYKNIFGYRKPTTVVPMLQPDDLFARNWHDATACARIYLDKYDLRGKRIILYVGRLSPEKNIPSLIKAFSAICKDYVETVLVLVGDGAERDNLCNLTTKLGVTEKVIFAGKLEGPALAGWFHLGSVLALVSTLERFGAVVNEGLLAGMPVVCSDKAGAKSLIREGANGAVVAPGSLAEIQKALEFWIQKSVPVTEESCEQRPSLMLISFQSSVNAFVDFMQSVSRSDEPCCSGDQL
jgi:glycosyltransferase involved in cell wall biosynthesis